MKVELKLFASLRQYLPTGSEDTALDLDVPEDATVGSVLEGLNIPMELFKLIFVNSVKANLDQPLKAGDRLGVFPAVAGG